MSTLNVLYLTSHKRDPVPVFGSAPRSSTVGSATHLFFLREFMLTSVSSLGCCFTIISSRSCHSLQTLKLVSDTLILLSPLASTMNRVLAKGRRNSICCIKLRRWHGCPDGWNSIILCLVSMNYPDTQM